MVNLGMVKQFNNLKIMKHIRNHVNLFIMFIMIRIFCSCGEATRYEINMDDSVPPAAPVFLSSEPLSGGGTDIF
jgi:hypothetical protein